MPDRDEAMHAVRLSYQAVQAAERMTRRTDRLIFVGTIAAVMVAAAAFADGVWTAVAFGLVFSTGTFAGQTLAYARMRKRSFEVLTSAYQEIELQNMIHEEEDA